MTNKDELLYQVKAFRKELEEVCEDYDYDYFEDILNVEYTIGYDLRYQGVRLTIALKEPDIYVDTKTGKIEGYWGKDSIILDLQEEHLQFIDRFFYRGLIGQKIK